MYYKDIKKKNEEILARRGRNGENGAEPEAPVTMRGAKPEKKANTLLLTAAVILLTAAAVALCVFVYSYIKGEIGNKRLFTDAAELLHRYASVYSVRTGG